MKYQVDNSFCEVVIETCGTDGCGHEPCLI